MARTGSVVLAMADDAADRRAGPAQQALPNPRDLSVRTWADVVHVDIDDPSFTGGVDVPDEHLLANLVWAAGSRTVRDVWVAGQQVLADREPTLVDRAKAQAEAGAITRRLLG